MLWHIHNLVISGEKSIFGKNCHHLPFDPLLQYSRPPPQYHPSVDRLPSPPQYRRWFSSPEYVFSWLYMTPFTAVFQWRRFFVSPGIGGIGCRGPGWEGGDCVSILYRGLALYMYGYGSQNYLVYSKWVDDDRWPTPVMQVMHSTMGSWFTSCLVFIRPKAK